MEFSIQIVKSEEFWTSMRDVITPGAAKVQQVYYKQDEGSVNLPIALFPSVPNSSKANATFMYSAAEHSYIRVL